MPPKASSGKEKDIANEDDVLQAVILADSFNKRFKPLTVGKPREIFVICRSYAEQIKAAIRDSKWSKPSSGIKIVPIITSRETFTPGDAMRDIYTRGIITTDFVLVMGDLVSNVKIDEVVRVHKERRRTNKDAIMTIVVKESGGVHRTRSKGESAVFVLDAETSECLHYESVTGYPPKKNIRIPREILKEHPEVDIRYDLIDCSIDVCSLEVPSLFQDNFDYGDIRRDFVHGVLTSDLLMKSIHCYVLKEGYAARVADTRSYDAVSKDILSRWTFPLVPDDNHPGGHSYEHLRGNKYIARGNSVTLSRTCKIGSNTLIGAHTQIGDNATLQASVIGQHCVIGPNVVLRNAYIFDGTHIGADSTIEESIIGAEVRVGEGSKIEAGCLVADGVVLGKGARLGKFERVSRRKIALDDDDGEADDEDNEEEEDSELEDLEVDQASTTAVLGEGSNGILWPKGPREDDEDLDEVERFTNQRLMRLGDTASDLELEVIEDTDSDSGSETETTDSGFHALSRTSSATSASQALASTPSAIHSLQAAAADSEFQHEVKLSLDRAFAENHSVDNASVELKTLRMASNVELRKVREAVVAAIVERIEIVEGDPAGQRKAISEMVARWGPLIDKIGGVDAVETVEVLQYHCAKSPRLPLFGQILAALYQDDIVEEDDIRAWHLKAVAQGADIKAGSFQENVKRCWTIGGKMIQQFDEQESDSEEEESEEESEEAGEGDGDDDDDDDDGDDTEEESKPADKATPKPPPPQKQEESEEDGSEEEEEESGEGETESGSEEGETEEEDPKPTTTTASQVKSGTASASPVLVERSRSAASEETIHPSEAVSGGDPTTPTASRSSFFPPKEQEASRDNTSVTADSEAIQIPKPTSTSTTDSTIDIGAPSAGTSITDVDESEGESHDASGEDSDGEDTGEESDDPLAQEHKDSHKLEETTSAKEVAPPPVVSISPPAVTEEPQVVVKAGPDQPKTAEPETKAKTTTTATLSVHPEESSGYLSSGGASSSKSASTVSSTKVGRPDSGVDYRSRAKVPTTVPVPGVGGESQESGDDTEDDPDETEEDSE